MAVGTPSPGPGIVFNYQVPTGPFKEHRPNRVHLTAAYLENREGGGARARRAPLHPRRAPYGERSSLEGLFGASFRRWRTPSGALQLHFPCKTFAIGGRRTIAKGAFGAQGGPHGPVPPLPTLLAPHQSQTQSVCSCRCLTHQVMQETSKTNWHYKTRLNLAFLS